MIHLLSKLILVCFILFCELFAGSNIEVTGSLKQNIPLSQAVLGSVHLSHKLKNTNAPVGKLTRSEWSCDFLTSYAAPDGRNAIQWVMPGGEVKRFKNRELKKSEPKILKEVWTPVKGKNTGDYIFLHLNGLRFEYKEGQLREVGTSDGKRYLFKTDGPRITSIRQDGSDVFLLSAKYNDLGKVTDLKIHELVWWFVYHPISGQLSQLFVATSDNPISFTYQKGLLTRIVYPDGSQENFQWQTDLEGYEKLSGLKLPDDPPSALLASDDHYQYIWGISQQEIQPGYS